MMNGMAVENRRHGPGEISCRWFTGDRGMSMLESAGAELDLLEVGDVSSHRSIGSA